jgi:hypothetical protein
MGLNTEIDLQTTLANLGRAYNDETGTSSIVSTVTSSTGPVYDVSLSRELMASYTTGGTPVSGSDYDTLSAFSNDLRALETDTSDQYNSIQTNFLSSQFNKINSFITAAYNTDIRSYLNSGPGTDEAYNSTTGPAYDIHGGFAQSYLDHHGNSLIFKVAEIVMSGSIITMIPAPINYTGIQGYNRMDIFTISGSTDNVTIPDENITTMFYSGPGNMNFEYGATGSATFAYILGSSGSYRTLAYPRINNAGYSTAAAATGASIVGSPNTAFINLERQPEFRYANSKETLLLKAKTVNDTGDRDFVFDMVKEDTLKATSDDVERTQTITVAEAGSTSVIVGTTGNTAFYRPYSIVSATNLQNGEVFEIWVSQ